MTQLKLIINSLPRDLAEFSFFLIIGFTAGSIGLIWFNKLSNTGNLKKVIIYNLHLNNLLLILLEIQI